jgi:hypothetical protein
MMNLSRLELAFADAEAPATMMTAHRYALHAGMLVAIHEGVLDPNTLRDTIRAVFEHLEPSTRAVRFTLMGRLPIAQSLRALSDAGYTMPSAQTPYACKPVGDELIKIYREPPALHIQCTSDDLGTWDRVVFLVENVLYDLAAIGILDFVPAHVVHDSSQRASAAA